MVRMPTNSSPVEISNPNNVSHGSAIICVCFLHCTDELWLSQCRSYQRTSPHHAALMISMLCHILVSVVILRPVKMTFCSFFSPATCVVPPRQISLIKELIQAIFGSYSLHGGVFSLLFIISPPIIYFEVFGEHIPLTRG